jgi:hypothetical protein
VDHARHRSSILDHGADRVLAGSSPPWAVVSSRCPGRSIE